MKVPFNTEWTACDVKQPATRLLHCLDKILMRHCRSVVLEAIAQSESHGNAGGMAFSWGGIFSIEFHFDCVTAFSKQEPKSL